MLHTPILHMVLLIACVPLIAVAQSTQPAVRSPGEIRGISWSDPRDNYNPAQIVPSGLRLGDAPEHAAAVAADVAKRATSVQANVVRVGINPPTVADPNWWPTYRAAVRSLTSNGMGVILCAWEQSPDVRSSGRRDHNGRFGAGSVESYAAMWRTVHADFAHEPNVIGYELLNEPFGYRDKLDEYIRDMRALINAMGDVGQKRILVAGLGYADDVQSLRDRFPEEHVWFAYHVYPNWFGGEAGDTLFTAQRYADEIVAKLAGVESRTVITEFGCWGGTAYDYSKPSTEQSDLNAKRHVAYLQGVAEACARLKLGSIYWYGDARAAAGGARRTYDLFDRTGNVADPDKQDVIRQAWRLPPLAGPATTATNPAPAR
jgi:hypothetical protein